MWGCTTPYWFSSVNGNHGSRLQAVACCCCPAFMGPRTRAGVRPGPFFSAVTHFNSNSSFRASPPSLSLPSIPFQQETRGDRHLDSLLRSEEHTSELQSRSDLVCRL